MFDILDQKIDEINTAIQADESPIEISYKLKSLMESYLQLVNGMKEIQIKLSPNSTIHTYFNNAQRAKLHEVDHDVQDIDNKIMQLQQNVRDLQLNLELHRQRFEEYKTLLQDKDRIEQELKDFQGIKHKVESSSISAKNEELIKLKVLYSTKKTEIEQLEQEIETQNQTIKTIENSIVQKIEQKKYNDGLVQLENDINEVVKDYETNYFAKQKQSADIIRYRIEFTKRVSGHLLPQHQYNKLDDMLKALDEMDVDIRDKLMGQ